MTITIGSNIPSLRAQRGLDQATRQLASAYEQLSSGQRINDAGDDAAGLAIADSLRAKGAVLTQAVRNVNDGTSYLNIAEGALKALSDITQRQLELAEQSAN